MARTDAHLDAMLRHLGAAYYESLHGRAARSDVTRALDTVEEHLKERPPSVARRPAGAGNAGAAGAAVGQSPHVPSQAPGDGQPGHHRRYARRVRDVMTTNVVTVDRIT